MQKGRRPILSGDLREGGERLEVGKRLGRASGLGLLCGLLAGCGWMAVPPPGTMPAPITATPPAAPAAVPGAAPATVIVQSGESLYAIARRNNAPIRAIIDANHLEPPYRLHPGQQLVVPHPEVHVVRASDTLYGVARQHNVEASELVRVNHLEPPYKILIGQTLILPAPSGPTASSEPRGGITVVALPAPVPAAAPAPGPSSDAAPSVAAAAVPASTAPAETVTPVPVPPPQAAADGAASEGAEELDGGAPVRETMGGPETTGGPETPPALGTRVAALPPSAAGRLLWPIQGRIISGFGAKEGGLFNDGINIAAGRGDRVMAADDGVVAYAGNEIRGFGNLVLVKHANGWMTAYAHNDRLLVSRGQHVTRGQPIAQVGSTGSVATPQLHFEVRKGSRPVDPMKYLAPVSS